MCIFASSTNKRHWEWSQTDTQIRTQSTSPIHFLFNPFYCTNTLLSYWHQLSPHYQARESFMKGFESRKWIINELQSMNFDFQLPGVLCFPVRLEFLKGVQRHNSSIMNSADTWYNTEIWSPAAMHREPEILILVQVIISDCLSCSVTFSVKLMLHEQVTLEKTTHMKKKGFTL